MSELDSIDGWTRIETGSRSDVSDHGEAWRRTEDSSKEIVIDRSDLDEPRDWKLTLPNGQHRYSRFKTVVVALATLYMRKGSF